MKKMIDKNPFYFVRHGETDWNRRKIYQGLSDIPLNKAGIGQAAMVASFLKNEPIAHIVTSPLIRAKQTADIINKHLSRPITTLDELKELSLGEKEGQPTGDDAFFADWLLGVTIDGAESLADFDARVLRGLLRGLSLPAPILFVSHGGVFAAIERILKLPNHKIRNCQVVYCQPTMDEDTPWISTVLQYQ